MGGQLNIGIVGAGAWAAEIATCLENLRGVRMEAIYNRTADKAHKLALRHTIPKVYGSFEKLCTSPEIDAVIVATHESAHLAPTLCALDAGKHVFVEKPMADTAEAARRMAGRARESGSILMPGHIVRFTAECQAAKRRLTDAGEVRAIRCFQHRTKNLYAAYCKPHIALSLMIHQLDLCRWFVGRPVKGVNSLERFHLGSDYPSSVWATLEFEGGAVATLESGWVFEGDRPIFWEDGIEIITEHERITIPFNGGYEARTPYGIERADVSYEPALRVELEYWLKCIEKNGQPSIVTPEDGVEAVALAERVMAGPGDRLLPPSVGEGRDGGALKS